MVSEYDGISNRSFVSWLRDSNPGKHPQAIESMRALGPQRTKLDIRGFSLVEMLVALLFTSLLMAGMATVFKASIHSFYTSGEKLSSIRRNRIALDLMYDDLNTAGMALVDITSALPSSDTASNPAFYILPNQDVKTASGTLVCSTDELYMAFDQPLPFEGTLTRGGGANDEGGTAVDKVLTGGSSTAGSGSTLGDNQYVIECGDATYAHAVKTSMYLQIKDDLSHAALQITGTPVVTGTKVTVTALTDPSITTQVTGRGDSGSLRANKRVTGSGVVFITPSQMVRYHIVVLKLDPAQADGIPCLIREQGAYDSSAAFVADSSQTQIIAENVSGFKVYLRANLPDTTASPSPATNPWAGEGVTGKTFAAGWTNGIQAALNTQLNAIARADHTTTEGNPSWYRDNPILVRLDITTRTAGQRAEYSTTQNVLAYKTLTQSLVLMPRHFGLTMK